MHVVLRSVATEKWWLFLKCEMIISDHLKCLSFWISQASSHFTIYVIWNADKMQSLQQLSLLHTTVRFGDLDPWTWPLPTQRVPLSGPCRPGSKQGKVSVMYCIQEFLSDHYWCTYSISRRRFQDIVGPVVERCFFLLFVFWVFSTPPHPPLRSVIVDLVWRWDMQGGFFKVLAAASWECHGFPSAVCSPDGTAGVPPSNAAVTVASFCLLIFFNIFMYLL